MVGRSGRIATSLSWPGEHEEARHRFLKMDDAPMIAVQEDLAWDIYDLATNHSEEITHLMRNMTTIKSTLYTIDTMVWTRTATVDWRIGAKQQQDILSSQLGTHSPSERCWGHHIAGGGRGGIHAKAGREQHTTDAYIWVEDEPTLFNILNEDISDDDKSVDNEVHDQE